MSILVTLRPKRTVRGIESNVTAGLSQVPYKLQRRDYTNNNTSDDDGNNKIQFNIDQGDFTGILNIGDIIYCVFALNPEYNGNYSILDFEFTASTYITINLPFTVNLGGGWIVLKSVRLDYRMLLNVVDPSTAEPVLPVPMSYVPNNIGELFVNVANFFSSVIIGGSTVNFQLNYLEYYDGQIQSNTVDVEIFVLSAKRQLLDEGGANLWRYLPNPFDEPTAGQGKQLGEFIEPFVYIGWRSWLATIYDENINTRLGGDDVGFRIRTTDVNNNVLDEQSFLQLPQNLPRMIIQNIPEALKTVANAYYISAYLNSNSGAVSDNKRGIIKKPCVNPVMLEWIGRNGASEQYMFSVNQEIDTEAEAGIIYEHPIEQTLDNAASNIGRITSGSRQFISLLAENIPQQHIGVLKYIKESPRVLLWLDQDGSKNIRVVVSGSYSTPQSTRRVFGDYSVTIRLPRDFDFTKPLD